MLLTVYPRSLRVMGWIRHSVDNLFISRYKITAHITQSGLYLLQLTPHRTAIFGIMRREEVRLTGKELYIYWIKVFGKDNIKQRGGGCTNKVILSRKTGLGIDTLVRLFTRQDRGYFENDDIIIIRVNPFDIEKGKQSMSRKGKGGMQKFIADCIIKSRKDEYSY